MSRFGPSSFSIQIVLLAIVFAIGIFLRLPPQTFSPGAPLEPLSPIHPQAAYTDLGFDEGLYRDYLRTLIDGSLGAYPQIVEHYIDLQRTHQRSILPPLRFLYLFCGYGWHELFGADPRDALRNVSALATMFTLVLSAVFAWRLRRSTWGIGVAALMAFAPTQLHMSQHGLIDGFFAFWALLCLWLLWENLRVPQNRRWLIAYTAALTLLVLTKENAFFVWIAMVAVVVANRWLQFGTVTRELLAATLLGPLTGMVLLAFFAGGAGNVVASYLLFLQRAPEYEYAIRTGDGPWYRYLFDLALVSPVVLMLAIAMVFRLDRTMKPEFFLSIFIAASYLIMCNVKYGMNLRYANMWDMPLRFLAFSQIVWLVSFTRRFQAAMVAAAVVLLAGIEFRQYIILAVHYPLYELISHDLLEALKILKAPY